MDKLIDRAIEALKSLPPEDCERIAWEIIERVEDKTEWDNIIATPKAQAWLENEAAGALKKFRKIEKNLSRTFISIPHDHLLREEPYWKHFDELPPETKKLAEKNYRLWKESPGHPGLRFKKIHATLPVFSFRVGMRNRTVGVEVEDDKIAWFWVGSFENFKALVDA